MTQINHHKPKPLPKLSNKQDIGARFIKRNGEWLIDIPKDIKGWVIKPNHTVYVRRKRDGRLIHVRLKECVNRNEYATHWTFTKGLGRMSPSSIA